MNLKIKALKKGVIFFVLVFLTGFILIGCNNETLDIQNTDMVVSTDKKASGTDYINSEYTESGNISVSYVTSDLIRKFSPERIIDISSETAETDKALIMIATDSVINDFQVFKSRWSKGQFGSDELLYEVNEFTPETPLFFIISFSDDMLFNGISYVNQSGEEQILFIHRNIGDNGLFLGKIPGIKKHNINEDLYFNLTLQSYTKEKKTVLW